MTRAAPAGSVPPTGSATATTAGPGSAAPVARPPVALYLHVPFCVSICPYCDFVVSKGAATRGPRSRIGAFLAALHAELDLRADRLDERFGPPGTIDAVGGPTRPRLQSVYLGGGTPSLLGAADVDALLRHVDARFGTAAGAEITLEANPGPAERGDLAGFADAGVTRISFGAQSLHAEELRALGRRHRPADVADSVAAARDAGIRSVNLDFLYDVPGQSEASWAATLRSALDLSPDHLSLYALTLDDPTAEGLTGPTGDHLPVSPGAMRWRRRAGQRQDEDRAAAQYAHAVEVLAAAGLRGYEISNWARPGHESRHNRAYWERRPYEAVGPGAHAFDGLERRWNAARLEGWLAALTPADGVPALPPGGREPVTAADAEREALILGLRLDTGVPATALLGPGGPALGWASDAGLLEREADRLRLTTRGRLLSNELFLRIV